MIWMADLPSMSNVKSEEVEARHIQVIIELVEGLVTCCFNIVVHHIIKDSAVLLGSFKSIDNEVIIDSRVQPVEVAKEPVCQGLFKQMRVVQDLNKPWMRPEIERQHVPDIVDSNFI